jgi:hypothetical protein
MAINTKIYLITNSFGVRQAQGRGYADFVLKIGYLMKKSANAPRYPSSKTS